MECLLCERTFNRDEIERGLLDVYTLVCSYCYKALQERPYAASCFGKPTVLLPSGERTAVGYSLTAPECQRWCPDRFVCRKVVYGDSD